MLVSPPGAFLFVQPLYLTVYFLIPLCFVSEASAFPSIWVGWAVGKGKEGRECRRKKAQAQWGIVALFLTAFLKRNPLRLGYLFKSFYLF